MLPCPYVSCQLLSQSRKFAASIYFRLREFRVRSSRGTLLVQQHALACVTLSSANKCFMQNCNGWSVSLVYGVILSSTFNAKIQYIYSKPVAPIIARAQYTVYLPHSACQMKLASPNGSKCNPVQKADSIVQCSETCGIRTEPSD